MKTNSSEEVQKSFNFDKEIMEKLLCTYLRKIHRRNSITYGKNGFAEVFLKMSKNRLDIDLKTI